MRTWGFGWLLLLWLVPALGGAADQQGEALAAKVNGVPITQAVLEKRFESYRKQQGISLEQLGGPEQVRAVQARVLDVLIDQELLWEYAERKGYVVSDEVLEESLGNLRAGVASEEAYRQKLAEAGFTEEGFREELRKSLSVSQLIERELAPKAEVTDAEVHAYYLQNQEPFRVPEQVRVRHILVKVDARGGAEAKSAAEKKIRGAQTRLDNGDDFAAVAKAVSEDGSAERGGDLGFISRDQTVKPFEEAAFALQPGQVSGVVETRFGLHLVKAEGRRGGDLVPEDQVKEKIRDSLRSQKVSQALQDLVKTLRDQGEVEVYGRVQ